MNKYDKIKSNFQYILKDFKPNLDYSEPCVNLGDGRKSLQRFPFEIPKESKIRFPFIVYLMFVDILEYHILPRFEKVAWKIPILYKNKEFVLAHRKFGFDISSFQESEELLKLAKEAIVKINKAIPLVEVLISPTIQKQVNLGNITIESKYSQIRNRYLFFRNKLEDKENSEIVEFRTKTKEFSWDKFNTSEEAENGYNEILRLRNSNSYFLYAMIDSYFSLLEHISVLMIPFLSHIKLNRINIEEFIGLNWKEKLQIILEHKTNSKTNQKIEILGEIKEQIRNPISHGHFHKKGKSFYVHMRGLGAIPFTLSKSATKFKFSEFNSNHMSVETIFKHFDDFDKYLESEKTKFGMKYIKRNLPVAFNKESATKYRRRMRTEKSTNKYIEETVQKLENAMNMDW